MVVDNESKHRMQTAFLEDQQNHGYGPNNQKVVPWRWQCQQCGVIILISTLVIDHIRSHRKVEA